MYEQLKIISYPDPRLRKVSIEVQKFDENLSALAKRMFELMREARRRRLWRHRRLGRIYGSSLRITAVSPKTIAYM